jgi:peptidoglycan/xylan/chitin deacetylase (PgdA/CDA1 family)
LPKWQDLTRELDLWRDTARTATFWWRDDDATAPTPALDRLLALQRKHHVPVVLAVIPARAETSLAERLAGEAGARVMQHGWAHANHAPVGASKAELGPDRPSALILGELARGQLVLDALFGQWLRVLVPPHNRIAAAVSAALPSAGYIGLSTYNARTKAVKGLVQVNTHVDIMNWVTRRFGGTEEALSLAIRHLQARRTGTADPDEPTGLLTHHLAHDAAAWDFTDAFLGAVKEHPAARIADPSALFQG